MSLPGSVQSASPFLLGVDRDSTVGSANAQQLHRLGFRFCIRYLSLTTPQAPTDLQPQEVLDILNAGLALSVVQHVLEPGWTPTGGLGTEFGQAAQRNAAGLGLPPGMTVWCDLEGLCRRQRRSDRI